MASTEESPLLVAPSDIDVVHHNLLYQRFSPSQKRVIMAIIAYAGLIPFLASGSFIPSIPEIARELNTTGPIISLAVSLLLATAAISSLTWATYLGTYGCRFVYLRSLPCLCIGSIGVALSYTVPSLMFWHIVQAFGFSSAMSVGAGVIGDIYQLEASLIGLAIAPICGGIATHYASWHYAQWALFFMGISALVMVALWLPETLPEEKLGQLKAEGNQFKILNPLSSLALLRSPVILIPTIVTTTALVTNFGRIVSCITST